MQSSAGQHGSRRDGRWASDLLRELAGTWATMTDEEKRRYAALGDAHTLSRRLPGGMARKRATREARAAKRQREAQIMRAPSPQRLCHCDRLAPGALADGRPTDALAPALPALDCSVERQHLEVRREALAQYHQDRPDTY